MHFVLSSFNLSKFHTATFLYVQHLYPVKNPVKICFNNNMSYMCPFVCTLLILWKTLLNFATTCREKRLFFILHFVRHTFQAHQTCPLSTAFTVILVYYL